MYVSLLTSENMVETEAEYLPRKGSQVKEGGKQTKKKRCGHIADTKKTMYRIQHWPDQAKELGPGEWVRFCT